MKKLLYIYLLLISFVSFSQTNDSINLYTDKIFPERGVFFNITDNWKFKTGTDKSWKNADFNDAEWTLVKYDSLKGIIGKKVDFNGKAWLRNTFEIDSTLVGIPLSLNVEMAPGVYSVYINGKLYKTFGKLKTKDQEEEQHIKRFVIKGNFVDFIFTKAGKQTIAIEFQDSQIKSTTNYLDLEVQITKQENAIAQANAMQNVTTILSIIGSVFVTLAVFHLILFLFYREFIPNLYFSLFSLSMGGSFFALIYLFMKGFNMNAIQFTGISFIILTYLSAFSLSGLVNSLFAKNKLRFKIFIAVSIIGLLILFWNPDIAGFITLLVYTYAFLEASVLLIKAIIKKVKGARILASGILLTIFFTLALVVFALVIMKDDGIHFQNDDTATGIAFAIIVIGMILSIFSIPFSMSAYLAWYFSHINNENEQKVIEIEDLTQQNLNQEKEKQTIIENINKELEVQVDNRKSEIEKQKSEIQLQNKTLEIERQKSEVLLLNILPEEVALELKEKGKTQSKFFDSVTILFTDFKDFTKLSEKVSSTELIEELNYCFKEFDRIISKYGIEKIKTIGDAYMAVSGLPVKDEKHAIKMVYAALEIRDFMEEYKQKRISEGKEYFEMRIGINSGEVVAGIVGIKKFSYDVWGTAVNLAAEMEVNGSIGKVNISENTYKLVHKNFSTELRPEKLEDSQVNMYFAEIKEKSVNLERAKEFILNKLTEELPKHLHYHNISHILDVYDAAMRYAKLEGISAEDTELLKVAALFHDSGFIVKADGHELISCKFAEEYLPDFGYSFNQIEKIKGMIMATRIPQTPKNHLEQILADADLDYLGRTDFEEISNGLFEELKAENKISDLNAWNKIQVSFFEKHSYFTESAKRLRNEKKRINLEHIKSQLL